MDIRECVNGTAVLDFKSRVNRYNKYTCLLLLLIFHSYDVTIEIAGKANFEMLRSLAVLVLVNHRISGNLRENVLKCIFD